ncbi:MAG: DHH family phosphoesterase [Pseudoflavonifractor sp.]|nr:DHH family phosphoesterase [Alloprevotella sp.]MCM1116384.1 DHH family phosphoesterase [Pseudoflavonifractor sp.]
MQSYINDISPKPKAISQAICRRFRKAIDSVHRCSIVCHVSPDGDAIGSSLALSHVLEALGKSVRVVTPDMPPRSLLFLPGADNIIIASQIPDVAERTLSSAEAIFCLDFNDLHRIDRVAPMIKMSKAMIISVDHHLDFAMDAQIAVSDPLQSSTCALLYHLLIASGLADFIDKDAATCLYTGMMTDTGNFSYNSNSPDLYLIIADLLRRGIDKDEIYRRAWNETTESRLRICGYALANKMELLYTHRAAIISLSLDELEQRGYQRGDTESLVNQPLAIPDIQYSIFLREDKRGMVKVSMRSKGSFPVNQLCATHFGGGGHLNAAGGEFNGSLAEAIAIVHDFIPSYDSLLSPSTL